VETRAGFFVFRGEIRRMSAMPGPHSRFQQLCARRHRRQCRRLPWQ
jgi:hypothetical protein